MRILLTGATGFIGGAFLRAALAAGHEVTALVRPGGAPPTAPGVRVVTGTLADPPWDQLAGRQFDTCVHSAWIATPGVYLESPENDGLVDASFRLLTRLHQTGLPHALTLGTCIEYAPSNQPLVEDVSPLGPQSRYARAKDRLRQQLAAYGAAEGLRTAWGRVFYPYGPGEHPARLASSLITRLRRGEPVVLFYPDSCKDYIYIEDLAAGILRLVETQAQGACNLGSGQGVTVRDLAGRLATALNRTDLVEERPAAAPDPYPHVVADPARLRQLGWEPRVSLPAGLAKMLAIGG